MDAKAFYRRYWRGNNIAVNPFDRHPGEWTRENVDFHMRLFRPYLGKRLLDFGCGDGQFLGYLSPSCDIAHGVDISEEAIRIARERQPRLEFKTIPGEKIPYPDEYFDTVSAIDVLEHLLDTETALEEIQRVLKPGGYFLIATSELTRLKTIIIALLYLDKYFYPASPHVRHFTKSNLRDLLKNKGFQTVAYCRNRAYLGLIPQGQLVVAQKTPAVRLTPGRRFI
jgi:ubiquinone/menaquinone biosynthesis C-methylase UbiE